MEKNNEVHEYTFQPLFKELEKGIKDFSFGKLDPAAFINPEEHEETLKIERNHAERTGFSIAPIVKEHRGINDQEQNERERRIEDEVNKRLRRLEKEAYEKGHAEGVRIGKEEIYNQTRAECEKKLESFTEMLNLILGTQADLVHNEKIAIQKTIRNLTKWVILRELKDDGEYIERLLEKLIEELQIKSNLLIQVNPQSFAHMPEVLEHVERVVGKLENVRVEEDYDIAGPGIVVDSDNGIVKGTLTQQFKNIDRLFEKVGVESTDTDYEDTFKTLSYNEEVSEKQEILDDESYSEDTDSIVESVEDQGEDQDQDQDPQGEESE